MKKFILILVTIALIILAFLLVKSCYESGNKKSKVFGDNISNTPKNDKDIQAYNLSVKRSQSASALPCDTLDVVEYVLKNYAAGSYLLNFDKTLTYNVPKPAVIYYHENEKQYIFGIVARSKPGERLIEPKNIVGYDQSFIDLDSTELGTAFFYLTLFECNNNKLFVVWEAPVPSHGGLNRMFLEKWNFRGIPYIKIDFHYARGTGHIDYNYFFLHGITQEPHLLMTYKGINFKRTLANINNDNFPDYYEFVYYDTGRRIFVADSIGFTWNNNDSLYVSSRNRNMTRPY
ncbi:MAG TPA: hypothetical protein VKA26_03910 [Ignavibacteriaceae bacterium]|nr:hypothetical protein [Ignavibacteriaceae bacterium]